jgi:ATP-dependent helicase/nuclease subunit A
MRSLAKKANDYVEVLRLAGVPVSCQGTAGYFEATEISDLLCLLKVLDNPQRDIELAAVLRSPFFRVSDTELAKIKINGSKSGSRRVQRHKGTKAQSAQATGGNFYDCMLRYCDNGPDAKLAGKLKEIIAQIEHWRMIARGGNLADLIWQVYRETNFLSFVSALPNGQARRANLLKLHDRAIQFEGFASSSGIPSLTRFVEFIEKLQEVGQDWAPAEPESAAGNAVRILSVHKSKGLEFPVVFLAELDSKFNKKDIYGDCLADADDTLGLQVIDRESNSKLRSLAHEVIAEQKLSTMLAEEMRILYVATTRARDRLILTASQKQKHCQDIITNGYWLNPHTKDQSPITNHQSPITMSIPDWQLRRCQSPLEWVLYALSDQKALHDAFETHLAAEVVDDGLFSFKLYGRAELKQLSDFVIGLKKNKLSRTHPAKRMKDEGRGTRDERQRLLAQVKESLAWRYQFGDAPLLPAKTSVTQLTHRNDEYIKFDYSRVLNRQPIALIAEIGESRVKSDSGTATPDEHAAKYLAGTFTAGLHYAGQAIGTATHLIMAQLDFTNPVDRETIERLKEKLVANSAITDVVAESINTDSILAFFQSELGQMALDKQNAVRREWPFTFALPVNVLRDAYCVSRFELCTTHDAQRTMHDARRTTSDETIIVQGIIDMLVRTPKGLVVIDFKTDRVTAGEVNQRAELYRLQLGLYSRAASAILKSESLGKWLYFLTPGCEVEIK